ncbi:MAG TPA: carboxymuconolactone decarboxylase family protein [Candidatus Dormibacteraeota bacterium]|jgi:AhpD family alkylhydroperoxidase|nr:carboxymuconolactone decarboxylase family protein [Candidatus Dormibacteraeota bacterium]
MTARMKSPTELVPGSLEALRAVGAAAAQSDLPHKTSLLVLLRASQINGCSVCTTVHARDARRAGETDERLDAVAAWRDTTFFTDAERAALALTEAVTRLSDRPDGVPDEVYDEASHHYDDPTLAALILTIAVINAFNRLSVPTRQMAGRWAS